LVLIGGEYSHAVRKQARAGDFRVQEQFGGAVESMVPPQSVIERARWIASLLPSPWLYVRVDGVIVGGEFLLMEVECIEPRLYLGTNPHAHERFAAAI